MLVDDLAEHDDIEVGVANAEHVVRRVADELHLVRDECSGVGRPRLAGNELHVQTVGLEDSLAGRHRGRQAGERGCLADGNVAGLGHERVRHDDVHVRAHRELAELLWRGQDAAAHGVGDVVLDAGPVELARGGEAVDVVVEDRFGNLALSAEEGLHLRQHLVAVCGIADPLDRLDDGGPVVLNSVRALVPHGAAGGEHERRPVQFGRTVAVAQTER